MAPKAAMKRPAAAAATVAESAAKRPAVARGYAKQCNAVAKALLKSTECPTDVLEMLNVSLPACLGMPKERRHRYQEEIAAMIGEVLAKGEEGLQAGVAAGEAKLAAATAKKDQLQAAEEAASSELLAREEGLAAAQAGSEEAAKALAAAKEALDTAKAAGAALDTELGAAGGKKAKLSSLHADTFVPIKEGSIDPAKLGAGVAAVEALGKEFSFDATLMKALPSAAKKAVADRGSFDTLVMEQIGAEFARCEKALEEQLANAEPTKAEHEAKIQAAGGAFEEATAKERECAATLDAAKAAQKEAAAAKRTAAKAARESWPEVKQAKGELEKAESSLQEFREGPLAAYRELRDLTEVIPAEPEKEAEEDAPMQEAEAPEAKVIEEPEAKVLEAEASLPAAAPVGEAGA